MRPLPDFNSPVRTGLSGLELIGRPMLNKGTAFTEVERDLFGLHGLLPPHVGSLPDQILRRVAALRELESDFTRYAYLRDLQDTNETLFYALLAANLETVMPLVYTPTVGEGCQRFSALWRRPRGLFLSYPNRRRMRDIFSAKRFDHVRVIVVSDGERILGLGDQGAGGMGIPIGKLALYTACAGLHPDLTLPIQLDVGTNNAERLADPTYIGWRHERIRGAEYDDFVEEFVSAVMERWPDVLLQWEDFAIGNASRLLATYQDRLCTFNDDIQGTAAAAVGALLSAINVTRIPLSEQRIVLVGAGSAGSGIAALIIKAMTEGGLSEAGARRRLFAVDRDGLVLVSHDSTAGGQFPFPQAHENVTGWKLGDAGHIGLFDTIANVKPTALIGVCGQAGIFTEEVIREMAAHVDRPVIFPLSNPTSQSEATPEQLIRWTEGRAVIGTGSPFAPVEQDGRLRKIDQTNNSYIFPGIGLGVIAVGARRVTDNMFMAAAKALAEMSPASSNCSEPLLPPIRELRAVALQVAEAVAWQAQADGFTDEFQKDELPSRLQAHQWDPTYRPYHQVSEPRQANE
jgi:malate dehydrogenase (oxaloacetate-decarboxylating)